jgi:cation transporter-like permease
MGSPEDQFKICLNQNLWGLVVGLTGLGVAEYFGLRVLFWFAVCVSAILSLSVAVTTVAYTINYWNNKLK